MTGPLHGVRVLELASLAPGPFAGTMLSDLGAEVLRLDRPAGLADPATAPPAPLGRGRRSVAVDLKRARAAELVLRLAERADVLVEGFRPGVCERLGIGPEPCLERNPRLVYARFTGWGQTGPLAQTAGHDIDYLAVSGALAPLGPAGGPPVPPLNYLADFAGGGMLGVVGILSALLERERSGRGQVVDVAMVDGAGLLTSFLHGLIADGRWPGPRGTNLLDGGAPFYRTYECADGTYVAVGAIEPPFYAALLDGLGLDASKLPAQLDPRGWPRLHQLFTERFASRTREEWTEVFDGTDACVAPVLTPAEATRHPQAEARDAFVDVGGLVQPAPAPRLSRTPGEVGGPAPAAGRHTREALRDWGIDSAEIDGLTSDGAVGRAQEADSLGPERRD